MKPASIATPAAYPTADAMADDLDQAITTMRRIAGWCLDFESANLIEAIGGRLADTIARQASQKPSQRKEES